MEVRINGPEWTMVGEFSPQNTGGWSTSATVDIAIMHDLTFVSRDRRGAFNLEWFQLLS